MAHEASLPGKPDFVFSRLHLALFVHGCFWHQHKNCRRSNLPKSNIEYWSWKLDRNLRRDKKVLRKLRELGWKTAVIWECQTRDTAKLKALLNSKLKRACSSH